MTQRDMAGYINVTPVTLRNWRKNKPELYEIVMKGFAFNEMIELNNKISTATPIEELKYYTGYLQEKYYGTDGYDVDYYKLNIAEKGIVKLMFKHDNFENKEHFYVELFNSDNVNLFKEKSLLNKRGITKYIGLDKGKYFIKISTYSASTKVNNKEYSLGYTLTKTDNIELENNDTMKKATSIIDGKYITGHYQTKATGSTRADKDYYSYMAKEGKYNLIFEHEIFENNDSLTIKIFDENMKQAYIFYGKAKNIKEQFELQLKDGKYYIEFQNIYHSSGQEYKFGLLKQ